MTKIKLYDTTLRDGTQREGISLTIEDKLRIARRLDAFGVAFIEAGFPGFTIDTWHGLVAPAATPKPIIDRLAREVAGVVTDPKIVGHLAGDGYEALGNTPDAFAAMITADVALWAEAVKLVGVGKK